MTRPLFYLQSDLRPPSPELCPIARVPTPAPTLLPTSLSPTPPLTMSMSMDLLEEFWIEDLWEGEYKEYSKGKGGKKDKKKKSEKYKEYSKGKGKGGRKRKPNLSRSD